MGKKGAIKADLNAFLKKDPAAKSKWEVILTYSGFHALVAYRFSHFLYERHMPLFARMVSQTARFFTGVEIHPAAKIGRGVMIDHGSGVVIGETCEIGDNVVIYQGVTLGGTGKHSGKRHPTIGSNVMISAGAKVLGPFKVGDNSKIGAGAVVLSEVPSGCTVVGIPGRVVKCGAERVQDLDQVKLPDPIMAEIRAMKRKIDELENKIEVLENENLQHVDEN